MKKIVSRRSRAYLVLAAAVAAVAGFSVSPATASVAATSSVLCTWEDSSFSGLAALAEASAARDGDSADFRKREKPQLVKDTEIRSTTPPATSAAFTGTVDVYFHVVYAGKSPRQGWVSQDQVNQQINVLNLTFSGFYGGYNSGFTFRLAGLDYTQNTAWYEQATFQAEVDMKTALKQGDSTDLNIYSTSGGGFLGWAYYPSIVTSNQYRVLDGVVVHSGALPGGYVRNYNLGYTATHEAGHWLGLAHTFEGGCKGHGDQVDDTPAMSEPTNGCPEGKDTCPEPGPDPIHNYMDYSYDLCYTEFTAGQSERAQEQWLHWRVGRAS